MGKNHHVIRYHYMFWTALVISVVYGCMPPVSAIIAGTIAQISVSGAFYIVEPISYFPILGIPGTYLTFLSGNTSNMRVPCSSVAQEAAGVEMGSDKGSVVSTIGIAVSIIVNIVILTIGAIAGNAIIGMSQKDSSRPSTSFFRHFTELYSDSSQSQDRSLVL